jgi:hypothetical protein
VVVAQERHVIAPLPSLLGGQHETPKLREVLGVGAARGDVRETTLDGFAGLEQVEDLVDSEGG